MKDVIEKFLLMSTDEVLARFLDFGGERTIVGKEFLFIPGTKPVEERILLVGHADTVFSSPPARIEWAGNMAKAGYSSSNKSNSESTWNRAYRSPPAAPKQPTKNATTETTQPKVVVIAPDKVTGDQTGFVVKDTDKPGTEEKKIITFGGKDYTWSEWEWARMNGEIPLLSTRTPDKQDTKKPEETPRQYNGGTTSSSASTESWGYSNSHTSKSRGGWKAGGLGADDRVGDALIWLMRRSGHSILITDGEECGGVGAKEAAREIPDLLAQHVFAIEVDRAGDQEMVFYEVSTPEFEKYMLTMTGSNWTIGRGSYTDIRDVCRATGICGVNMAAGYYGQHTSDERFVYDFWLRTFKVVQKMVNLKHPRFELPRPKVHAAPATAATAATNASVGAPAIGAAPTDSDAGKVKGAGSEITTSPWLETLYACQDALDRFERPFSGSGHGSGSLFVDDTDFGDFGKFQFPDDEDPFEEEVEKNLRGNRRGKSSKRKLPGPQGEQIDPTDLARIEFANLELEAEIVTK